MTRSEYRQAGIPPVQCGARTRRGTECQNWVRPGGLRCRLHGGNTPQALRKADQRATLAQLLQGDPRPLPEVLLDATHTADAVFRDLRLRLVEGEGITPEQLDRLVERARAVHHLARTTVETGVVVKMIEQQRASVAEVGLFISEVVLDLLHHLPLTPAGREYALNRVDWKVLDIARTRGTGVFDVPDGPVPEEPTPPADPILLVQAGA